MAYAKNLSCSMTLRDSHENWLLSMGDCPENFGAHGTVTGFMNIISFFDFYAFCCTRRSLPKRKNCFYKTSQENHDNPGAGSLVCAS